MGKVSQDRNGKNYQQRLAEHLQERPECDEQVAKDLGRLCRQGFMSEQKVLEVLRVVEGGRERLDQSMNGMQAPDWYAEHDRVFMPGEIGGVKTEPSSLDWE